MLLSRKQTAEVWWISLYFEREVSTPQAALLQDKREHWASACLLRSKSHAFNKAYSFVRTFWNTAFINVCGRFNLKEWLPSELVTLSGVRNGGIVICRSFIGIYITNDIKKKELWVSQKAIPLHNCAARSSGAKRLSLYQLFQRRSQLRDTVFLPHHRIPAVFTKWGLDVFGRSHQGGSVQIGLLCWWRLMASETKKGVFSSQEFTVAAVVFSPYLKNANAACLVVSPIESQGPCRSFRDPNNIPQQT